METIQNEDIVISLMQFTSSIAYSTKPLISEFINLDTNTLTHEGDMTRLEKTYLIKFLKNRYEGVSLNNHKEVKKCIRLSFLLEDEELTHDFISNFTKTFLDSKFLKVSGHMNGSSCLNIITKIFKTMLKFSIQFPNRKIDIMNDLRFILTSVIEKGNQLITTTYANDFSYSNPSDKFLEGALNLDENMCLCNTCKGIDENILSKPLQSASIIVFDSKHIFNEFQKNLVSRRTPLLIPLKELLTITEEPYGSFRKRITIIKKPLMGPNFRECYLFVQSVQELYSKIPSKAKSARTGFTDTSEYEPPLKIQKTDAF